MPRYRPKTTVEAYPGTNGGYVVIENGVAVHYTTEDFESRYELVEGA